MSGGKHNTNTHAVPSLGVGGAGSSLVGGSQPNPISVQHRASRVPYPSTGGTRDDIEHIIPDPSAVNAKGRNPFCDDLADQTGTVVMIGVTIPGLGGIGKVAVPFIYRPFHAQPDSQGS